MKIRILGGPFRGAPMQLALRKSKRKMLGVYEHELTSWWDEVLPNAEALIDVGAGDGYFTYGVAHILKRRGLRPRILAFEPGLEAIGLKEAAGWPAFSDVDFEFRSNLVGAREDDETTALDSLNWDSNLETIVKVDVEGAEAEVLAGGRQLLERENSNWLIEVHGRERVQPVLSACERAGREVELIEPRPHWLFGAETRETWTGWVVTV